MFTNKLSEIAKAIAICSAVFGGQTQAAEYAPVQELREGDDIGTEVFKDGNEFSVISFYKPSEGKSSEVDALFEAAKGRFEQMIDDGSLSQRKVGWFRVDIDAFPQLAPAQAQDGNQLLMGKLGQRKYLNHEIEHSEQVDREVQVVERLRPLTGDFMDHIECSSIADEDNPRRNEIVYFGPQADLAIDGPASVALHLAISEVYHYDDPADRTWFGWNNEAGCRKGLDSDKNRIGIFNGNGLPPRFYEQGSDQWPDIDHLQTENTHRIVLAEADWTPRAYNAIALFNLPCVITFVPGLTKEGRADDWRVQLSTQVNERLRSSDDNPHRLFTLAQPYVSAGAEDRLAGLYDLSYLLDVKGETEPKVFMVVPGMNELVELEAALDS